jgi:hypothetical protein
MAIGLSRCRCCLRRRRLAQGDSFLLFACDFVYVFGHFSLSSYAPLPSLIVAYGHRSKSVSLLSSSSSSCTR